MSNIYIQEPPTNGKVLLKTTVGDIDIELWSKEAPLACRNFVQLCMEGYYDNNIFHRLVKDFIVQTGDASGTGFGSESIYDKMFKDEFHSRLRFVRRGLVALANDGQRDSNGSQFFFTLEATPELQNKHTIFGKVTGSTLFNMIRLGEGDVDKNERPLHPHKILSTKILNNPFDDIQPRVKPTKKPEKSREQKARENVKASKNFALLSFGDEAEEEEEEIAQVSTNFKSKSKSSHDLLEDEVLSSMPVVDKDELNHDSDKEIQTTEKPRETDKRKKLKAVKDKFIMKEKIKKEINDDDEEIEQLDMFAEEKLKNKTEKIEKAKDEFKLLKQQIIKNSKKHEKIEKEEQPEKSSVVLEFLEQTDKFKKISKTIPKKGQGREEMCWDLLQNFKKRLQTSRTDEPEPSESDVYVKPNWLKHRMQCTGDDEIVLARDANIRNEEDWYDIYDPRNPINKRRRQED